MIKVLSILIIILALVMAVVPVYTDCLSQGRALTLENGKTVPMKCHWTGIAEIGAALPVGLAGIFMLRTRRKETARTIGIMGMAGGALAILFPTVLIGVCSNPDMLCNMVMRPTLILAGTLAIAASLVIFFRAPSLEDAA